MNRLYSKILALSAPTIFGLIIQAMYQVLNAYFVGFLGVSELATVNLTYPLTFVLIALGQSIGIGTAAITSRSIGRNDLAHAHAAASSGLMLGILAGGTYLGVMFWKFDLVARIMGTVPGTEACFYRYGRLILVAFLLVLANTIFGFIARSQGGTLFSMVTLIIAFALNALFDPIFIFWMDLGIRGAACATLLAQIPAVGAYIWYFSSNKSRIRIRPTLRAVNRHVCAAILSIGIPTFMAFVINVLAVVLVNRQAAAFGAEAVAGIGIALRLYTVSTLPVMGLANGVQSLIGACVVDTDPAKIKALLSALLKIGTGYGACASLLFLIFSRPLAALFSTEAAVTTILSGSLAIYMGFFAMVPVQLIAMIFEQSKGNARLAMYVSFARQGIYLIPLLLVLPGRFGINGIAASQLLSDLTAGLSCVMILWRQVFAATDATPTGPENSHRWDW
ncbi:MATE family efflux transporter [Desulfoluna butyratoxydans]|uniref:Multi antimicrobial extrusion protein n=1 Tax=Desulfoluna butyratoxydans TaxID=231438 RepID=A0A4U8YN22_9BACT|nr:MATE family efflux transporter [Desulfoluna butyratoxydans]VFQ45456.1 multi antimicrobial extrusion protein [Desulfoluna butyratoxydans]